jgi:hypothetical protein
MEKKGVIVIGALTLTGLLVLALSKKAKAEPTLTGAGTLEIGLIWYEPLAGWENMTQGRQVPLGAEIYLAPGWLNKSDVNKVGHIDLSISYPDGQMVNLSAIKHNDEEAIPGDGWMVKFSFVASKSGNYNISATLTIDGLVADTLSYYLIAV